MCSRYIFGNAAVPDRRGCRHVNAHDRALTGGRVARRTLLGGLVGVAGAGALSACSAGSASSGSGASGGKELSILLLGPTDKTIGYLNDTAIPAFADSTGFTVQVQQSDWGSGFQKVVTAAASGTLTDLVMLGGIWTAPLASKNALLPLDDLLADYADRDTFYPATIADCRYQDKTYAMPLYSDSRTAMYRKSLLEKAGADPAKLPTTWQEYAALAKKLAKAGGGPVAFPTDWNLDKSVGLQQSFAQLILQAGGTYYDASGKAQFSSDQGVQALEYLMSFYRDKLSSADSVFSGTGATPFVRGDAAMQYTGMSTIANARQNKADAVDDIVVGQPLASTDGGKPITSAWINKIGISAKTKNRDAAWQFLQHLNTPDVATFLGEQYGGLPARKDLSEAPYLKGISPNLIGASQYVVPQPPSPNMLTIAPQINTFLQQAIRLDGTAKDILTAMDAKINEINGV